MGNPTEPPLMSGPDRLQTGLAKRTYRPVRETGMSRTRGRLVGLIGLAGWGLLVLVLAKVEVVFHLSATAQPWATVRVVLVLLPIVPILGAGVIGRRIGVSPRRLGISVDDDHLYLEQGDEPKSFDWAGVGAIRPGRFGLTTEFLDTVGGRLCTVPIGFRDRLIDEFGNQATLQVLLQAVASDRLPPRFQQVEPDLSRALLLLLLVLLIGIGIVGVITLGHR